MKRLLCSDLRSFVDTIYLPQKLGITAAKTRDTYRLVVRQLSETVGRPALVRDLTTEEICRLLRRLADSGISLHTVQQRRNYVVALANWCSRRGILPWWVTVERLKTPAVVPRAWAMTELEALYAACGRFPGTYCGVPASAWWQAFHLLAWDTGERTGALLAIRDDWLSLSQAVLSIPAEARKGGQDAATYHLRPGTVEALKPMVAACRARGDSTVFAFPATRYTFYHHYTRLLKLAGLPSGRKFKPQRIRRTFATFLEKAGGDATEALGHSTRRVTKESYLDPTMLHGEPPNRKLPPLDKPPPSPPPLQ